MGCFVDLMDSRGKGNELSARKQGKGDVRRGDSSSKLRVLGDANYDKNLVHYSL